MKEIIEDYTDIVVSVAGMIGVFLMLGGCCVFYKQIIQMLLDSIFYK